MNGISSSGKSVIGRIVEDLFDKIALQFLGDIPKLRNKKFIIFSSTPNYGLANLFIQSLGNRNPNEIEQDALKSLLNSSYEYIESLKSKTGVNITERIDGLTKQAKIKGTKISEKQVQEIIDEEMEKAKSNLKSIAEFESTKIRNIGTMLDIGKVSASAGESDPNCFFIVLKDEKTCSECKRLHLNPDGTPRVWKLSELKHGYHKKGDEFPSAWGLHNHCRCTLTYLSSGWGFDDKGKIAFVSLDHDEYQKQRNK